jgi:hypothetical protein
MSKEEDAWAVALNIPPAEVAEFKRLAAAMSLSPADVLRKMVAQVIGFDSELGAHGLSGTKASFDPCPMNGRSCSCRQGIEFSPASPSEFSGSLLGHATITADTITAERQCEPKMTRSRRSLLHSRRAQSNSIRSLQG